MSSGPRIDSKNNITVKEHTRKCGQAPSPARVNKKLLLTALFAVTFCILAIPLAGGDTEDVSADDVIFSDLTYIDNKDGTATVTGFVNPNETELVIPSFVPDTDLVAPNLPVVAINSSAFADETTLVTADLGPVQVVEGSAFSGCTSLKTLVSNSVTTIEASAFSGCTSLEAIDISSATTFQSYAFNNCTALNKVTMQAVNTVNLFIGCANITDITLKGDTLYNPAASPMRATKKPFTLTLDGGFTEIPFDFLQHNTCVSKVVLPTTVVTIGENAFSYCSGLKEINLENVTTVVASAFQSCSSLEAANVQKAATIGANAFTGCNGLKTVDILASVAITGYAFSSLSVVDLEVLNIHGTGTVPDDIPNVWYSMNSVATVNVMNGITSIGKVFSNTSKITVVNLPESVTSLVDEAFMRNTSMTSVALGGVTTMGVSAFYGCTNLVISDLTNITSIGSAAFFECESITELNFSTTAAPSMGGGVFRGCTGLTTVAGKLPATIPSGTFDGCSKLVSANITGVTKIENQAFRYCGKLTTMDLSMVTKIGENAFEGCALEAVDLSSMILIGSSAFKDCPNITTLTLPVSYSYTGHFTQSTKLNSLNFVNTTGNTWGVYSPSDTVPWIYSIADTLTVTIGDGIENIGDYAFNGCKNIKTLTLPSTVTSIGVRTFQNCTGLKSIDLRHVNTISPNAFNGCGGIEELTLPASLSFTSTGMTGLKEVTFVSDSANIMPNYIPGADPAWIESTAGTLTVVIGSGITNIGNRTFHGSENLNSITLPDSVTEIGQYAFTDSGLDTINLGKVKTIGGNAFDGCSFTILDLSNIESIGLDAFRGSAFTELTLPLSFNSHRALMADMSMAEPVDLCAGLTKLTLVKGSGTVVDYYSDQMPIWTRSTTKALEVTVSDDVKAIGNYTFQNSDLKSLTLPKTLESIGVGAFRGCTTITSIDLSKATAIGDVAFYNCTGLTTVTLNTALTSLSSQVFYGCSNLDTIDLSNLTVIGYGTFYNCGSLTYADLTKAENIGNEAFYGCTSLSTVDVLATAAVNNESFKGVNLTSVTIFGSGDFSGTMYHVWTYSSEFTAEVKSGVTSIINGFNRTGVTSVTLPSTVTSLDAYAFTDCKKLTTIDLGGVLTIGDHAFKNCELLVIKDLKKITSIGEEAFYGCIKITEVELNETTACTLGTSAFAGCNELTGITGKLPETIPAGAFNACAKLTEIDLSKVKVINSNAFNGCSLLADVDLSSVTSVFSNAFTNCPSITKLKLPISFNFKNHFSQSRNINDLTFVTGSNTTGANYDSAGTPWASNNASVLTVTLEEGITGIGSYTFYNCANITSIGLPDTVKEIGDSAFRNCEGLNDIDLSKVEIIRQNAFNGCDLDTLDLSSIDTMYGNAFVGNEITKLTVPISFYATTTYYGAGVFSGLEEVNLIKGTGVGANYGSSVSHPWSQSNFEGIVINIDDGVTSIGSYMFHGCAGLRTITLPSTIESIGQGAFYNSGITSLSMSVSATFSTNAFYGCSNLTEVILTGTVGVDHVSASYSFAPWRHLPNEMTVIISDTVESIGAYTFANLLDNKTIRTYAKNLSSIATDAFKDSKGIIALPEGVAMDPSYGGLVLYYSGSNILGMQATLSPFNAASGTVSAEFFTVGGGTPGTVEIRDKDNDVISGATRSGKIWSFTSNTDEMSITAGPPLDSYTIQVGTVENGKIMYRIEGSTTEYDAGSTIEVEIDTTVWVFAKPNDHYEFAEWTSAGEGEPEGNELKFISSVKEDLGTVTATFSLKNYNVKVSHETEDGVEVTDNPDSSVYGTEVTFKVTGTSAVGVYVEVKIGLGSWTVINEAGGEYTIPGTEVTGDIQIRAVNIYTFTADGNGSFGYVNLTTGATGSGVKSFTAPFGHNIQITPVPDADYRMIGIDGKLTTAIQTIDSVAEDVTLKFIKYCESHLIDGRTLGFELKDLENAVLTTSSNSGAIFVPRNVEIGSKTYNVSGVVYSGVWHGGGTAFVVFEDQTTVATYCVLVYDGDDMTASFSSNKMTVRFNEPDEGEAIIPSLEDTSGAPVPMTDLGNNEWSFSLGDGDRFTLSVSYGDAPVYNVSTTGTQSGVTVNVGSEATHGIALKFTVTGSSVGTATRDVFVQVKIGSDDWKTYVADAEGDYVIAKKDVIGDITIKAVNMYVFKMNGYGTVGFTDVTSGESGSRGSDFKVPFEHKVTLVPNPASGYVLLSPVDGTFVTGAFTIDSVSNDMELEFVLLSGTVTVGSVSMNYERIDSDDVRITSSTFNGAVMTLPSKVTIGDDDLNVKGISGTLQPGVELIIVSEGQTNTTGARTLVYDGNDADVSITGDVVTVKFDAPPAGKTMDISAKNAAGQPIEVTSGEEENTWTFPLAAGSEAVLTKTVKDPSGDGGGSGAIIAVVAVVAVVAVLGVVYFMFIRKP
jgi:hypothetical protein